MVRAAEVRAIREVFYKDINVTPPPVSTSRLALKIESLFNSPMPTAPAQTPPPLNYQRRAPLPRLNALRPEEAILFAAPKPAPQPAPDDIQPNDAPVRGRAQNEVPVFIAEKNKEGTGNKRWRILKSDGNQLVYGKSVVHGTSGRFHKAQLRDGTKRGLKQARLTSNEKSGPRKSMCYTTSLDSVVREATHMRSLGMNVYGVYHTNKGKAFIETDLFVDSLNRRFHRIPTENRAAVARHSLKSMMQQLGRLHAEGSVHRDIKNDNLLFNSDGHVQIADPGLLLTHEDIQHYDQQLPEGTLSCMPPECFGSRSADKPTPGVDVWAAGCAYLQQLTHSWPLQKLSREAMGPALRELENVRQAYLHGNALPTSSTDWAEFIDHAHRIDPEGTAFVMKHFLEPNPHRRIDAVDVSQQLDGLRLKGEAVSHQDIVSSAIMGLAAAAQR